MQNAAVMSTVSWMSWSLAPGARSGPDAAVALVVALIFLSEFLRFPLAAPVSVLFIGAMLALLLGLVNFLVEVRVATLQLRIGKH
jgi:hypothetical protein